MILPNPAQREVDAPLPWGDPDVVADPYPHYHRLRARAPIYRDPLGFWLVSRHADVAVLLRDARLRKDFTAVEGNRVSAIRGGAQAPMVLELSRWMLNRDPPDHTRLRGLVTKAFTPRAVEGMRARIREIAHELLGRVVERGTMDVIGDFAYLLPVTVITELLGLPIEDREQCREWAEAIGLGLDPLQAPETVARADAAVLALTEYVRGQWKRRRNPGEDLLSALIAAEEGGSRLTEEEVVSTVNLLFFAGHHTTRDLIGNGFLALLRHPDQAARLRAEPSMIRGAVEELLRYDSPVQMTPRYAREDVEIGGVRIAAGEQVSLLLGAANRDPEQFERPDALELARPDAGSMVSFGGGVHFCLGAALARTEAQIAIPALLRLPQLEPRCVHVEWRPQIALRSLKALPVSFRPVTRVALEGEGVSNRGNQAEGSAGTRARPNAGRDQAG